MSILPPQIPTTLRIHLGLALFMALISACVNPSATTTEPSDNPHLLKPGRYVPARFVPVDKDSITPPSYRPAKGQYVKGFQPTYLKESSNFHPAGKTKYIRAKARKVDMKAVAQPKYFPSKGQKEPALWPKWEPATPSYSNDAPFHFSYLTIEQGLNSNLVEGLMEDQAGRIWAATGNGVSIWDGLGLSHYTQEDGLISNLVRVIKEDRNGNIWICTMGGLSVWDGTSFIQYNTKEGLTDNNLFGDLFEDSKGNMWIGTYDSGLNVWDGSGFYQYTETEGLSENGVRGFLEDQKGRIWIATRQGLTIWNGTAFFHFTQTEGLSSNGIYSLLQEDNGKIWIGTGNGVNVWDPRAFEGWGGLLNFSKANGLSGNHISCLLKDRDGKIWIGTEDGGLSVWNGMGFFHYTTAEGLSNNFVNSLLEDKDGKIWIGTNEGGLNILDPIERGASFLYPSSKGFTTAKPGNLLLEDRYENIWIGTTTGLKVYDETGFVFYEQGSGLISNRILGLIENNDGKIWVATSGGGANVLTPEKKGSFLHFSSSNGLTGNSINCLVEGRDGKIWLGTINDGLNVWDGSGFSYYHTAQGMSHYGVRAIMEDHHQRIWVGSWAFNAPLTLWDPGNPGSLSQSREQKDTGRHRILDFLAAQDGTIWVGSDGSGLSVWDSTGFYQFTTAEGLTSNVVSSIYQEKGGNIWVGTNKGLNLLRPTESPNTWEIETFDHRDGLHNLSINDVLVDTQNRLWSATRAGVERIHLDQLKRDTLPPKLTLSAIQPFFDYLDWRETRMAISEGEERLTGDQGLSLATVKYDSIRPFTNLPLNPSFPYNINQLTLQWQGLHWSAPHKIQYSYLLQGKEKAWSPLVTENKVTYQDLRPGTYLFKVRAVGGNGLWSDTATYAFRIRPPWWQTTMAYLVYGLLLSLCIWFVIQWRTTALRRRQKYLEETIQKRTAEVVEQKKELEIQKTLIQQEKERSDALLLNILPAQVASELKATGQTKPTFFEEISILFSDFKGFTNIVASIPGKQLVKELDEIFKKYDDIMESLGLEKIQTVGDAYLAAGGFDTGDQDHAKKCVLAGKQIIHYLAERNQTHSIKWQVRVGIHTGPITAGVIGKKKYSYDLFGDTINIAARIESSGEPGKINISAYTHHLIKEEFPCTYRGKINAKGKGELDMYFVDVGS